MSTVVEWLKPKYRMFPWSLDFSYLLHWFHQQSLSSPKYSLYFFTFVRFYHHYLTSSAMWFLCFFNSAQYSPHCSLVTLANVHQTVILICWKLWNVPLHLELHPDSSLKLTKPYRLGPGFPLVLDHFNLVSLTCYTKNMSGLFCYVECCAPKSLHGSLLSFKLWS